MKLRTRTNQPVEGDEIDNLQVKGDLEVTGDISGDAITGDSIIENMSGYSAEEKGIGTGYEHNIIYCGAVKNGNKLTLVCFGEVTRTSADSDFGTAVTFNLPADVASKLYPATIGGLSLLVDKNTEFVSSFYTIIKDVVTLVYKNTETQINVNFYGLIDALELNTRFTYRFETTFLLSDNMISQE